GGCADGFRDSAECVAGAAGGGIGRIAGIPGRRGQPGVGGVPGGRCGCRSSGDAATGGRTDRTGAGRRVCRGRRSGDGPARRAGVRTASGRGAKSPRRGTSAARRAHGRARHSGGAGGRMGGVLNMRFFLARPAHRRVPDEGFPRNGRLRLAVLAVSAALLSACTSTGASFQSSGLDRIVVGRTTMEQASGYLGAHPVDVWRQGDTTLARWAYKGSVATDAVYFRQEAWLRFGPDGTFQRMENSVNLPLNRRPRTAEEADQQARTEQAARQEASRPPVQTVAAPAATEGASEAVPVAVQADDAIQPASLTIQPPAPAASGAKPARTRAGS